jgi:hypothetical protein
MNQEPELVVEVDFGAIEAEMNRQLDTKANYCLKHDWGKTAHTPCHFCVKEAREAEQIKHQTKKKVVSCVHCGLLNQTYWGSKPYTCKSCLPTEQHHANVAEFMRELVS